MIYDLWAYRASVSTTNRMSPNNLVYGDDGIRDLELNIHSLRFSFEGIIGKETFQEQRLQELAMLNEQRINGQEDITTYHKTMNTIYNSRVIELPFLVSNIVLYKNQRNVNVLLWFSQCTPHFS